MVKEIDGFLNKIPVGSIEDSLAYEEKIAKSIRFYLSSLDEIAIYWRKITAPRHVPTDLDALNDALLSFGRLEREANFIPLLIAVLRAWGEHPRTVKFVKIYRNHLFPPSACPSSV